MNFFADELAKNDLVAAPMAGISTAAFRLLLREWTKGLIYTEMVSVEGTSRANPNTLVYLDILDDGPTVAQLFGGNSTAYKMAAEFAEKHSKPSAFDINMGCPVKKVIKSGGGSALLRDTAKIAEIIRSLRSGTKLPFSVKIRTGWDEKSPVYLEILDTAQSEGADALVLHGRSRPQMFGGQVNYEAIAQAVSAAKIPIIGNGNVTDYASYLKMKETGVQGVMIGRGMMHAPWVFEAIRKKASPQSYYSPQKLYEILLRLRDHMRLHAGDDKLKSLHYFNILRKYSVWFSKGLENAAVYRAEVFKNNKEEDFLKLMKDYFVE